MKNVIITGVSSGFGKQALQLLLEKGHRVIAGVRGGRTRMETMGEPWIGASLDSGQLVIADVHLDRPDTLRAIAPLIAEHFDGQLDVLINNAGSAQLGPLEPMTEADLRGQMEVNFMGPTLLTQACLPFLRRRGGRILNVSSALGYNTLPFYGSYTASKYALEGLTESLHYELRPFGIEVCLLEPGGFKTNFMKTAVRDTARWREHPAYQRRTERFDEFIANTTKNLADPSIVARILCQYVDARSVPLRRPIGVDGIAIALSHWIFPRFMYVWAVELFFRRFVFRDTDAVPLLPQQTAGGEA